MQYVNLWSVKMNTALSTISGRKMGTGRKFTTMLERRKKKSPNEVREYQIFMRDKIIELV